MFQMNHVCFTVEPLVYFLEQITKFDSVGNHHSSIKNQMKHYVHGVYFQLVILPSTYKLYGFHSETIQSSS